MALLKKLFNNLKHYSSIHGSPFFRCIIFDRVGFSVTNCLSLFEAIPLEIAQWSTATITYYLRNVGSTLSITTFDCTPEAHSYL